MFKSLLQTHEESGNHELNQVDLAFVVDTTGSMGAFINVAREHMVAMLIGLVSDASLPIDLSVGVVEYRDHPPQEKSFVSRTHDFTRELRRAQRVIDRLKPDGGGDAPEAVYDGLVAACDSLTWRPHARRLAVLVGDAPPQGVPRRGDVLEGSCLCGLTLQEASSVLERAGVLLYALGLTNHVRASFTMLAQLTGGEYYPADQGEQAIEALKSVLTSEFEEMDFDHALLQICEAEPSWNVDSLCTALETSRGRVSASLSRLGRRGLLRNLDSQDEH